MANIMSQVRFSNNTSRNSFDLSHKVAFTAKAGEILPFVCQEVLPKDKFVHKPKWFTRTNPLNTAAYTRLTEYVDYYFVPTRILWNKADQFFSNLPDSQHATSITNPNNQVFEEHPYFYYSEIVNLLNKRNYEFEMSWESTTPLGNIGTDIFGMNRGFQGAKLLEYLGYGNPQEFFNNTQEDIHWDTDVKVNPFPLLAYQAIYQYFERNDQWEQMRADFFNIDYNQGGYIDISSLLQNGENNDMFDLRYANFKKDLFSGLMPRSQYGDEATATIAFTNNSISFNFETPSGTKPDSSNLRYLSPSSTGVNCYLSTDGSLTNAAKINNLTRIRLSGNNLASLSVLALRQAEALQKYKEIKQSNKYDYRSQMKALWNANVSRERANMPYRIGGFVNGINIDEVVNTSITDDGSARQAANIAGKGAGAGSGFVEFESEEHGYIIGIYKVCPEIDYANLGLSRMIQKTNIADYANPVFDKLGMEEVMPIELAFNKQMISLSGDAPVTSQALGYAPRYYDYKTAVDSVKGGFATNHYDTWVSPITSSYSVRRLENNFNNYSRFLDYGFFKINPAFLNPIFTNQIETFPEGGQFSTWDNEQFLINMYVECTAVRNLDYNGLPY